MRGSNRITWPSVALAATLLAASCGGDGRAGGDQTEGGTAATVQAPPEGTDDSDRQTASDRDQRPERVCEDPQPTEVGIGEAVAGAIDDADPTVCHWVVVPEGRTSVTFTLSGLSDDLTLSVGYGYLVTVQFNIGQFVRSDEAGTADEVITVSDPGPGIWFVKVGRAGSSETGPYRLTVTTEPATTAPPTGGSLPGLDECEPPAVELALDEPTSGELVDDGRVPLRWAHHCVVVPAGATELVVEVTGLSGNLDLLVREAGEGPSAFDRQRGGDTRTVRVERPAAGPWYLDLVPAHPGAGSAFTITARVT